MTKFTSIILLLVSAICFTACSENTRNKVETIEITKMDSTSKQAKAAEERLKEQTKKVEESIEKLDEEFKTK